MEEVVVETKICLHCRSEFDVTDKDQEFYKKISPLLNGKRYDIPAPKLCPDCRQQRRLSFRNERNLYKRNCDATGKEIISMYSPDKGYRIFDHNEWWNDAWDPLSYGRDFDFTKCFFEQFEEMKKEVPKIALVNMENENCNFNNYIRGCKNAYLSSVVYYDSEDIYYSGWIWSSKNIYDCLNINASENCFSSIFLNRCYNSYFLINSSDCRDCHYSRNLSGCRDCMFCSNLVNKRYCIENVEHSEADYMEKLAELNNGSFRKFKNWKKLSKHIDRR